ncbi:MAG: ABC transporter permease subunit [Treponema sp.]|uniref:ABC transporter permease n=1 Tax=Treponema sp. TaxID=166 RepID=UPI00298E8BEE|nr:ABC transporter permease subunit [Treponema sp.]MCQ2600958.1 ABC transporter permease subunit [Treponema sp.]
MAKKLNKDSVKSVSYPLLFGVIVLLLWQFQIIHGIFGADTFTLPLPSRIVSILVDNFPKMSKDIIATVTVALGGLVLGSILGFVIAMIAAMAPHWGAGGLSLATAFNAIPIIAIAPILNNLTRDFSRDPNTRSMLAKILVVMITCTVSMAINAYRGFTELKPFSLDLFKSYAAKPSTVFFRLRLPNCVPYIFTALRISVPGCVISAMVSEYFAEYIIGVGRQIRESIVLAQYATAWAYIVVACLIGIILYVTLILVESFVLRNRTKK